MKKTVIAVAAIVLAGAFGSALAAGDAAAGKAKFAICAGCHGPTGAGNEALKYPKLAGLEEAYVAQQLHDFKSGKRQTPMAATMKAKLGIDRAPYLILGACNPALANAAIDLDANVGTLLPCNVILRQDGDTVVVRFMDPLSVLGLVDSPDIGEAAGEARQRLERVCSAVGAA